MAPTPSSPNRAAILALGKLLGDDKVATVGGRDLELGPIEERDRLRQRIRRGGRPQPPDAVPPPA